MIWNKVIFDSLAPGFKNYTKFAPALEEKQKEFDDLAKTIKSQKKKLKIAEKNLAKAKKEAANKSSWNFWSKKSTDEGAEGEDDGNTMENNEEDAESVDDAADDDEP